MCPPLKRKVVKKGGQPDVSPSEKKGGQPDVSPSGDDTGTDQADHFFESPSPTITM